MNKFETGNIAMKKWTVLIEATIQNMPIKGTIKCHTATMQSAKRLARMTFINQLRRAGIWARSVEVDEPYEVKSKSKNKEPEIKYKKVVQYQPPYWDDVEVIDIVENDSYDFTFSSEELDAAAILPASKKESKKRKRRSSDEVILSEREKKEKTIKKKEQAIKKKEKASTMAQDREDLFNGVEKYFTQNGAKIIKIAATDLNRTYQRVRYALFQIAEKGYNGIKYELVQTEINGSKAFQLIKGK